MTTNRQQRRPIKNSLSTDKNELTTSVYLWEKIALKALGKKIKWLVTRHPMLYYIRFALICRNYKGRIEDLPTFNDYNKKEEVPAIFFEINAQIPFEPGMDGFEKTLLMSNWLRHKIKGGRGLGLASDESLRLMLNGKGGICSDYSQMLNVFCLINDVRVREWGTVEKFYNPMHGHNYNEVYSEKFGKWIAIDFQKNLWFHKTGDQTPLSVTELFSYLREGNDVAYTYFSDWRCIDMWKIGKTYSKNSIPFLITDYNNKTYDNYLNRYKRFPPFIVNAMLILLRKNYHFLFVLDNYKRKLVGSSKK